MFPMYYMNRELIGTFKHTMHQCVTRSVDKKIVKIMAYMINRAIILHVDSISEATTSETQPIMQPCLYAAIMLLPVGSTARLDEEIPRIRSQMEDTDLSKSVNKVMEIKRTAKSLDGDSCSMLIG